VAKAVPEIEAREIESEVAMELNEVCELIVDCEHKTAPTQETGYPSIRTPNIGRGHFILEGVNRVSEETYRLWTRRAVPQPGDLIMAREAPVGNVAMIPPGLQPCLGQRTLLIRPDRSKVEPLFLNYFLNGPHVQGLIHAKTNGATVAHLNMKDVRTMQLPELPPLPVQRRIAGILSAYDELMENSQRRIRILEAMARALYREWFVHFRFPGSRAEAGTKVDGHEKSSSPAGRGGGESRARLVTSPLSDIPQGWEITELAKVCADGKGIQTGPFGSQLHEADYSDEGVPVVMPKDLIGFRIRTDGIARIPEETADKLSRHRMQPGDIGRRAFIMAHQAGWFCGTGCLRVRPNPQAVNGWYLFNYLGQDDVVGLIQGRAQGVTMPNLNTGVLSSVPVRLPPRKLQDDFARLTFPMAEAHEALTAKIEKLRRTRDLLLPRLLSGQVKLEEN
jgi:type I restriction enzyme S subunit